MNLTGKTPEQIRSALRDHSRSELVRMIVELATLEQWFRPSEIAQRRRMNVREVREAMKAGKLGGGYFRRRDNVMLASASGVSAWDRSFFVAVSNSKRSGNGRN